jgi:hypothetical protein
VRGQGYSFLAPRAWRTSRTARAIIARSGNAVVSTTTFTLVKPYDPARFGRASAELDRVAAKLAAQSAGRLTSKATTTVAGRKVRAYDIATSAAHFHIGFVLAGKREYQLLCQAPPSAHDPDGACALLFKSFALS